jgi:NADH dehydrogenase
MDWAWAYFTSQRHARVFPDPHALEPNAMLVRVTPPAVPPVSVTAATPVVTPAASGSTQGASGAQPSPAA